MDTKKYISVIGAREHNLKNINVSIPKDTLTVITGPSGSGKSTLALDILYAEGQRRYIESLSSYARQFLGVPSRPDVDRIDGLCPAIAIDQKTVGHNPRSTVGTITEIYDYLRVLFARIGTIHCPQCLKPVTAETPQTIANRLMSEFKGCSIIIAAPIAIEKKGEFGAQLEALFLQGYYRFVIDGQRYTFRSVDEIRAIKLKKSFKHSIDVFLDMVDVIDEESSRLHEAIERANVLSKGLCKIIIGEEQHIYSSERMCIGCTTSFAEIEPRLFSFNSPLGACKTCHGLGVIVSWQHLGYGYNTESIASEQMCGSCHGARLNAHALAVTVGEKNIFEIGELSITRSLEFFKNMPLDDRQKAIVERLLAEIVNRYIFLSDVGLGYLTINRTARTLSGGESQRIRLATQIGSALSGVLYILDEPSIGLHQRDNDRLILTLKKLRDQGNTVIVVEHDLDTIAAADHVIDMGPAAGILGGTIVSAGSPEIIKNDSRSLTGAYLSGQRSIERIVPVRQATSWLELRNARLHNLKNLTVQFPLGLFCGVSGVSGSGKSTLILDELVPCVRRALLHKHHDIEFNEVSGVTALDSLVVIDQNPIGRTPRSNPATYLGIFDEIRKLFAAQPESNARGYTVGRFSFNVGGGRCNHCKGDGILTIEMHFLPDVVVPCSHCKGLRYNAQTLEITYKGKNIAEVLDMTAREALSFFAAHANIAKRVALLCDVGLDYVKLGQPSTTLSGGEAQRIKLVDELAKRGTRTLYVLDEPTTGLHSIDIEKLLIVLNRLVEKGNTVLVIEHNIDVLKTVDYLIDMGPEGGDQGGTIVVQGTPYEVASHPTSHTGAYIRRALAVTKKIT